MIPGMNPRKMQQMMKQMGIQQSELNAKKVIIQLEDKNLIINNPSVQKVNMMGQENYQISGNVTEEQHDTAPTISQEDIQTVMDQAGVNQEIAKAEIEKADGDLAQAIMNLTQE